MICNERYLKITGKKYENLILFLACISIQCTSGQFLAFGLLIVYFFIKFVQVAQSKGVKLNINHLLLVLLWFIIIISLVKFNQNTNIEFFIEFFWLSIGLIILSFIIVLKWLNSKEILDILVSTSTIMGIIIVTGYFLGFSINHLFSAPYAGTRLVGGLDGPNELAAFNLLPFTYSLNMMLYQKKMRKKYILNVIVTAIVIVLTWSRGGFIGMCLALVISIIIYLRRHFRIKNILQFIILALIIVVLINSYVIPNFVNIRKNASGRLGAVPLMVETIKKRPVFGWGLGTFNENTELSNATPHNGYIFILYAGGILSFILYSIFLYLIFRRIIKQSDIIKFMLFLTFLIQEMLFNHLIRGRVSFVFWILVVLIFSGTNLICCRKQKISVSEAHDELQVRNAKWAEYS